MGFTICTHINLQENNRRGSHSQDGQKQYMSGAGMDFDPDLYIPSGRWRSRGGVGGASAGPWHQTQPGLMDPMRCEITRTPERKHN